MAYTAHQDEGSMEELYEDEAVLEEHAKNLAEWVRKSSHFIMFTGAGISTSAGIPDFRGPNGAWTLKAQGRKRTEKATDIEKAMPTIAHMAIVALINAGYVKYVVSQNVDGLHRKSGIPPSRISELHGNDNCEVCSRCGKQYLRDYPVRNAFKVSDHKTGRTCDVPECNGKLMDTMINFGETLPEEPMVKAFEHAKQADLCLVLGSSLTVSPACKVPGLVGRSEGGRLVICNLQRTPYDYDASLRVHARCDDLMMLLLKELGLELPAWKLQRVIELGHTYKPNGTWNLFIKSSDVEGTPSLYIKTMTLELPGDIYRRNKFLVNAEHTQYSFNIPERPEWRKSESESTRGKSVEVLLKLSFYQYYLEPDMQLVYHINTPEPSEAAGEGSKEGGEEEAVYLQKYLMEYDPAWRKFTLCTFDDRKDVSATVGRGPAIMGNPDDEEEEESEKEKEKKDKEAVEEEEQARVEELILVKKLAKTSPLVLKTAPVSNIDFVKGQEGEKHTLTGARPRTVCIVNCKNGEYVVQGPSLKIVIEGCTGVTVTVDGTVISGVVEIINCKETKLHVNRTVPTLQIDGTDGCDVEFASESSLENVITAKSKAISTALKGGVVHRLDFSEGSWEDDQYITRMEGGSWQTERIVRCVGGYVSTQRELDHYEEKEKQFDAAMMRFVASTING